MAEFVLPYQTAIWTLFGLALLNLGQLLVSDIAGIRAKHKPGFPVEARGASFLFRSSRAFANTNESLGAFLLLVLASVLLAASPHWTNILALGYLASRIVYTLAYYMHWAVFRSVVFGLGIAILFGLAMNIVL